MDVALLQGSVMAAFNSISFFSSSLIRSESLHANFHATHLENETTTHKDGDATCFVYPLRSLSSPAVVGSTVPVAVLAVPVRVLAVQWGRAPWRLGAPDTVLVLSLDMGESLSVRGGRGQKVSHRFLSWFTIQPGRGGLSFAAGFRR